MSTPSDLVITPRDRRFGRAGGQSRWWLANDPIATAFYNALSVTFPRGEAFFIDSVRGHRDGAPEQLQREIAAFIKQEVMHTREHVSFNKRISDAGYDITRLEQQVVDTLELTKGRPIILNLAVTMALEHYTAILAQMILTDKKAFPGGDDEIAEMWRWHAVEEIEHKGVAYDTWLHATKNWTRWQRWRLKTLMMLIVTKNFWVERMRGMADLLAQDGITGARAWGRILWYMFGNPGPVRKLVGPWARYFLPGFHPWHEDDRHLVQSFDSAYAAARMDGADGDPSDARLAALTTAPSALAA